MLYLEFGTGSGTTTWATTSAYYDWQGSKIVNGTVSGVNGNSPTSPWDLTLGTGEVTSSGEVIILSVGSANSDTPHISGRCEHVTSSPGLAITQIQGQTHNPAAAATALRLIYASGNIASGTASLYQYQ